jgi:hypothetical protein
MKIIVTVLLTSLVLIELGSLIIYYQQVGGNIC